MVAPVYVGTSGWVYKNWRGQFYPRDLPARLWLQHLATRLEAVEINGTFYRLGRPETFERWRAQVPPGFVFALKASRYVTHMLKLKGGVAPLANFFAQGILLLGSNLGPILWQLPPQLRFERKRALDFFKALPRDVRAAERLARRHDGRLENRAATRAPDGRDAPVHHVLEVRHESWLTGEAQDLIRAHDVAVVSADTAGRHPFAAAVPGGGVVYVRLHGSTELYRSRYQPAELTRWARRMRGWAEQGLTVHVYFDNTDGAGPAPFDAERLRALVSRGLPETSLRHS